LTSTGSAPLRILTVCTLTAVSLAFAGQWNTLSYGEWSFDSGTKRIMAVLAKQPHSAQVRVGASWLLCETINYYISSRNLAWVKPVTREGIADPQDYFILVPSDFPLLASRHLTVLYTDPDSKAVLAKAP
jgi:hypothetical protein